MPSPVFDFGSGQPNAAYCARKTAAFDAVADPEWPEDHRHNFCGDFRQRTLRGHSGGKVGDTENGEEAGRLYAELL
jgi:hypothetical protein